MNLEQFIHIKEVEKTGSLTKASKNLHITLSAISQSISTLESELGLKIFTRSRGQKAIPTSEGKKIISKASEVLCKVDELIDEAQFYTNIMNGELKIATIPGPMHFLVNVIAAFKKEYPHVDIEVFEKGPMEIIEDITNQKIDIGLMVMFDRLQKRNDNLVFERLLEGKMVIAMNKNHPLAMKKEISAADLHNKTLVLYDDEVINWYMDNFIRTNADVTVLFTSNNTTAITNAIVNNLAVTIGLDYSFLREPNNHDQIKVIPLQMNDYPVYYGWVRNKAKHSSTLSKHFISKLKLEL